MRKKAIVIGAGAGGLATAVRLAHKGYEVTVFEANDYAGGKATSVEQDGFFWGFGPSLFTFPELLDDIFRLCGRNPDDYYKYTRIDPICNYFYPDGTRLSSYADKEKFATELHDKTGEPRENVIEHLDAIGKTYALTKDTFLLHSVHKIKSYLNWNALSLTFRPSQLKVFMGNMNKTNERKFKDPRVVQLFNRYATYNGSNPYKAPATQNLIAHPEYNEGGYFLEGGMPDLSKALHKLAIELGVKFEFNALVDKIEIENNIAKGVQMNGQLFEADVVVSNMDVVYTYNKLLPQSLEQPKQALEHEKSTSALIFYWGINRQFPELDLHNIFFSGDYPTEFEYLTDKKLVYSDPTIYIFCSSKYQPKHAPDGCENWFTLINVPHDVGQDWDTIIKESRANIIKKISKELGVDITPHIVTEHINYPKSIEAKTRSYLGSLYGNSSNGIFSTFMRHPNFSRQVPNLYFCGGSVHPGGGIPLCLISAKIVDELVG